MKNNYSLGKKYEGEATEILVKNGYKIVITNYCGRHGEIDIIAQKDGLLVIIEVKYRKDNKYGSGLEAVDKKKMHRIYITAEEFIYKNGLENMNVRFDCICFSNSEVTWLKNIAWGDEIGF